MSFLRYPMYRASGLDWLGELPSHWSEAPLKRSYRVIGGSTPKSDNTDFWDGDTVWVTPGDLSCLRSFAIHGSARMITQSGLASCAAELVPAGSVVLSTRAPIGSVGVAKVPLATNQGCRALVPRDESSSEFLAYLLSVCTEQLNARGKGTTFLELSGEELSSFRVPVPPVDEQRTIAAFLDEETTKIDALVAEQQRLVTLLREQRAALIIEAVTKGISDDTELRPSGIPWVGDIPAHWTTNRLKQSVSDCRNGIWGDEPVGNDDEIACIRVADFNRRDMVVRVIEPTRRRVTATERRERLLTRGDLLLEKSGGGELQPVGFVVLYDSDLEAVCSNFVARMRLADGMDPSYWRYLHAAAYAARVNVRSIKQTSGIQNLDQQSYLDEYVPYPPAPEQVAIAKYLDKRLAEMNKVEQEVERAIALLQERRAALISAAVTGQIDVRTYRPAEELVPA